MTNKILDLWKSSALIQGSLALLTTGAIIYLAVVSKPIPEILVATLGTILGFYFGTKNRLTYH